MKPPRAAFSLSHFVALIRVYYQRLIRAIGDWMRQGRDKMAEDDGDIPHDATDYGDIPRDAKGDPVFLILPPGLRESYENWISSCLKSWRETGDPLAVAEAATVARLYRQTLPAWLDEAIWSLADRRRTKTHGKRAQEAAVRLSRYMRVRDLHASGLTWEASYAEAASASAAEPDTVRMAYKTVAHDLRLGRSGRYHILQERRHRVNRV